MLTSIKIYMTMLKKTLRVEGIRWHLYGHEKLSGWTLELYIDTVSSEYSILFTVSLIMNTFY